MWLGSHQLLSRLDLADGVLNCLVLPRISVQDTARDLGVVIDSRLTLSYHVAAVCRSGLSTTTTASGRPVLDG